MNTLRPFTYYLMISLLGIWIVSCSGSKELTEREFQESNAEISSIINSIPDYQNELQTVKGKGRAIVSEPGNTERVTLNFSSNRQKSLVTVRNSIGIEGGQLLTDGDTLLVYNKVDKVAQKIPIRGGDLNRINKLASLNILDMMNYVVSEDNVETISENETTYKLQLNDGAEIFVNKATNLIREVVQPDNTQLPYSRITYEAYSTLEGFKLPRRISIFGTEKKSKISLQLTSLELNPKLDSLYINLPNDITVYNQ